MSNKIEVRNARRFIMPDDSLLGLFDDRNAIRGRDPVQRVLSALSQKRGALMFVVPSKVDDKAHVYNFGEFELSSIVDSGSGFSFLAGERRVTVTFTSAMSEERFQDLCKESEVSTILREDVQIERIKDEEYVPTTKGKRKLRFSEED